MTLTWACDDLAQLLFIRQPSTHGAFSLKGTSSRRDKQRHRAHPFSCDNLSCRIQGSCVLWSLAWNDSRGLQLDLDHIEWLAGHHKTRTCSTSRSRVILVHDIEGTNRATWQAVIFQMQLELGRTSESTADNAFDS